LFALSEMITASKKMLEVLKIEVVEAFQRLKIQSEMLAKKIKDAG